MEKISPALGKFKEELYLVQQDIKSAFYERAIQKLDELILMYPNRAEHFYEYGKLAYNFWRNDEAEHYYLAAINADPNYFPSYTQLALIYIKERRYEDAQLLLDRSLKLKNKDESDAYFYFGLLYQHLGDVDRAIEAFTKSIQFGINEFQIELSMKFINASKSLRGWE